MFTYNWQNVKAHSNSCVWRCLSTCCVYTSMAPGDASVGIDYDQKASAGKSPNCIARSLACGDRRRLGKTIHFCSKLTSFAQFPGLNKCFECIATDVDLHISFLFFGNDLTNMFNYGNHQAYFV